MNNKYFTKIVKRLFLQKLLYYFSKWQKQTTSSLPVNVPQLHPHLLPTLHCHIFSIPQLSLPDKNQQSSWKRRNQREWAQTHHIAQVVKGCHLVVYKTITRLLRLMSRPLQLVPGRHSRYQSHYSRYQAITATRFHSASAATLPQHCDIIRFHNMLPFPWLQSWLKMGGFCYNFNVYI